jgi:hypothetical protein
MPRTSAKRTVAWVLDHEVLPQLKDLAAGQKRLVEGQRALEEQAHESGLNGHNAILKTFLDDQMAKKKSREARDKVLADLGKNFAWLKRPGELGRKVAWAIVLALISGYGWGLFDGKITFPATFH